MKKRLLILAVAAGLAACNNNPKTSAEAPKVVTADTALSISQDALNDKTPVMQMNGVNDTIISKNGDKYVKVQHDTTNPAAAAPEVKAVHHHSPGSTHTGSSAGSTVAGSNSQPVSGTETASAPAEVKKKKKISSAVKGTVIGAGSGAVIGAIVSKKKGTGAVVGGLLGAGAGYIIGHKKDKKQQQTQPQNQ